MTNFLENLQQSLFTGFIDKNSQSFENLQPKILINDKNLEKKILSSIIDNLIECESFTFSVAFLTSSGVVSLNNTFRELEEKNINGKIIISDYANFTQPEGLRKLLKFKNIKSYFLRDKKFHGKCFLFNKNDKHNLVIGSSNLTSDALSTNLEINLQITAASGSKIINDIEDINQKYISLSSEIDNELIDEYEEIYNEVNENKLKNYSKGNYFDSDDIIFKPNSMQIEAIENLEKLRSENKNKALVISATGTGKTVMSAFDVKKTNSKKMLFVVHRENIARAALNTFSQIFKNERTYGVYTGNQKDIDKDFIFSTVQTINNPVHINKFNKEYFDYIIIDETHRAGTKTYSNVLNYFKPKFLLGMTATPERTDGFDIFSLFDYNIGYEIRLNRALDEGLLCPFHYFGVTDISVDGQILDDNSDFNLLVSEERVERIIETINKYDCDDGNVRGLIFCSRVDEADGLSILFNRKGLKTICLSGKNTEEERAEAIIRLESNDPSDKIDYIFTVDIFNEGIDIPKINQIIMLRPTQSSIIFVQQLGRGLRKVNKKEYLTVIDFIGNYQNNYMIPVALFGDTSNDKDTIRKLLSHGSSLIAGSSTINFDQIARERIFESINSQNLQLRKDLLNDYKLLKYQLGRIPMMMDFLEKKGRDPFQFVNNTKSSYYSFVKLLEDQIEILPNDLSILLGHFSRFINNGKRIFESLILEKLLENDTYNLNDFKNDIYELTGILLDDKTLDSVIHNVNFLYEKTLPPVKNKSDREKRQFIPLGEFYKYSIVLIQNNNIVIGSTLSSAIKNKTFTNFLIDSTKFSIQSFLSKFDINNYLNGFIRYEKYSRKEVHRLLNWKIEPTHLNVGGYGFDPDDQNKTNCPIFVNYHKKEDISDTIKYKDHFIDPITISTDSKNNVTLNNPIIKKFLNQKNTNLRLPLFINKKKGEDHFYFMGDLTVIENSFKEEVMEDNKKKIVKMKFKLDKEVNENLYKYIISQ